MKHWRWHLVACVWLGQMIVLGSMGPIGRYPEGFAALFLGGYACMLILCRMCPTEWSFLSAAMVFAFPVLSHEFQTVAFQEIS